MPVLWLWADEISAKGFTRKSVWQRFGEFRRKIAAGRPIDEPLAFSLSVRDFLILSIAAYLLDEDVEECMVCLHVAAEFGEKLLTLDESKLRSIEDLGSIGTITQHYDCRPLSTDIDREQAVEQALQEYAQWYDGQIIRDGDRVGISYIDYSCMGAWDFIQVINCAIASGDMPLTRRIAATPSRKSDFRLFPGETIWYARLLKHYILGNTAEARRVWINC